MGYASTQRRDFSAALLDVGADAPTLCDGWTARDLAAHCWVRERNPKALPGIAIERFAPVTEAEMAKVSQRMSFVELATRLAERPPNPIAYLPGGDDLMNLAEYVVHTEDVRRANGLPRRVLDTDTQDVLWRRLPLLSRMLLRSCPVGVRLERSDTAVTAWGRRGFPAVTLVGLPSELLLFLFGRDAVAEVKLIGDDASVADLRATQRGV